MSPTLKWARSSDKAPYPNVWSAFVEKESKNSDKVVQYRIQDLPKDRFEDAIAHVTKFYLRDEPISEAVGGLDDEDYVDDYHTMWRAMLNQGMSLICLREGSDEIVAINIVFVVTKGEPFFDEICQSSKSKAIRGLFEALHLFNDKVDVFEKYGVDFYLSSMGLSVDPKYRGLGLGQRLLEARRALAQPFGIKLTNCYFSSDFSNRIADQAGFQLEIGYSFSEIGTIVPSFDLKNIKSEMLTMKTLRFN